VGVNLGFLKAIAFSQIYAKGYACGNKGISRSEASYLNYSKGYACGITGFQA